MHVNGLIEKLASEEFDELSLDTRQEIINHISTFEECNKSTRELLDLEDKELVRVAYWVLTDYVRTHCSH